MVRAASSLPVPFSPVISIHVSVGAIIAICFFSAAIGGLFPFIECFSIVFLRRYLFSSSSRLKFSALLIVTITLSIESGFSIRSNAPSFVAFTALSIVPCPVIIIT